MAADWYCEIDDERFGPLTPALLKQMADRGTLRPSHLIWKKGMPKKVPARSVKGLFDGAATVAEAAKKPAGAPARNPKKGAADPQADMEEAEAVMVEEFVEVVEEVQPIGTRPPESGRSKPPAPSAGANKTSAAGAPPASAGAKSYRVLSAGKKSGPFSLAEIRALLKAGKLGSADMVGIETWLPVATVRELFGAVPATKPVTAPHEAEAVEVVEDIEIVEVEEVAEVPAPPPTKGKAAPTMLDQDLIPMDEEFKIA